MTTRRTRLSRAQWREICTAYVFSETRAAETANVMLQGTVGVLIVDGYAGYNGVVGDGGRIRAGCWTHARRKFFEALKTAPEAREVLELITWLYRVEHDIATRGELGTDVHRQTRLDLSAPIVERIDAWMNARNGATLPKSPLGKAVTFAINRRESLKVFLGDPKVPLDNNAAERALRIMALGHKDYLFVMSEETGHNLAVLQTICHTCMLHDINPYEYIRDIIVRVGNHPHSRLDELLPSAWAARDNTCKRAAG